MKEYNLALAELLEAFKNFNAQFERKLQMISAQLVDTERKIKELED